MRWKIVLTMVAVVLLAALAVGWYFNTRQSSTTSGAITLVDLPDHYCPAQAEIVATSLAVTKPTVYFDSNVTVKDCRIIELLPLGDFDQSRFIYLKLPQALALKLQIDSPNGSYQVSPSLGDVNGDNVINQTDEQQVSAALLTTDSGLITANDLDQDGHVTVLDLSLTRLNYRIGSERPDGQDWSKS